MKKKMLKNKASGFESDSELNGSRKIPSVKNKHSKRKLSIYDEYEDLDDSYEHLEKFNHRHK